MNRSISGEGIAFVVVAGMIVFCTAMGFRAVDRNVAANEAAATATNVEAEKRCRELGGVAHYDSAMWFAGCTVTNAK